MTTSVRHRLLTPPPRAGGAAIAIVQIEVGIAADLDEFLRGLAMPVALGAVTLRDLLGVDRGVLLRASPTSAQIMPHGGQAVLGKLFSALAAAGCPAATSPADPFALYSESEDLIDACALDAIARAPSPLAIDAILRQRELWRAPGAAERAESEVGRAGPLRHLLDPPTVLLLGGPNIGKSALTNAMAGRPVSVVADEAGTTRDHVGVSIDLAGLVVRWIDAPGLADRTASDHDREAMQLARRLIPMAHLALLCIDAADPCPVTIGGTTRTPALEVVLRADLVTAGSIPAAQLLTSARAGLGLTRLALAVRRALIPDSLLACPPVWRFHPALPR